MQHGDMSSNNKLAALNKFRSTSTNALRPTPTKILVVYDVQVKTPEVSQVPLVLNYGRSHSVTLCAHLAHRSLILDLPKAVEEYAHRLATLYSSTIDRG